MKGDVFKRDVPKLNKPGSPSPARDLLKESYKRVRSQESSSEEEGEIKEPKGPLTKKLREGISPPVAGTSKTDSSHEEGTSLGTNTIPPETESTGAANLEKLWPIGALHEQAKHIGNRDREIQNLQEEIKRRSLEVFNAMVEETKEVTQKYKAAIQECSNETNRPNKRIVEQRFYSDIGNYQIDIEMICIEKIEKLDTIEGNERKFISEDFGDTIPKERQDLLDKIKKEAGVDQLNDFLDISHSIKEMEDGIKEYLKQGITLSDAQVDNTKKMLSKRKGAMQTYIDDGDIAKFLATIHSSKEEILDIHKQSKVNYEAIEKQEEFLRNFVKQGFGSAMPIPNEKLQKLLRKFKETKVSEEELSKILRMRSRIHRNSLVIDQFPKDREVPGRGTYRSILDERRNSGIQAVDDYLRDGNLNKFLENVNTVHRYLGKLTSSMNKVVPYEPPQSPGSSGVQGSLQ